MLGSFQIVLVGNLLQPGDDLAVPGFLDRDVGHGAGRRGAVPMLVLGRAPDDVAGADLDDRLALALGPAHAGGDEQGLAERMRVPWGARARLEAHNRPGEPRRRLALALRFDKAAPGEIRLW